MIRRPPRTALLFVVLAAALALLPACVVHRHRVGNGPIGAAEETRRQFYIFFGWLRLNDVDTQRIVADASSYDIETEFSLVDVLLAPLLLPLTVTSRTVTVYR